MRISNGRAPNKGERKTSLESINSKSSGKAKFNEDTNKNKEVKENKKVIEKNKLEVENKEPKVDKETLETKNTNKSEEKLVKKEKVKINRTLGKLSGGRLTACIFTGIISSVFITGVVYGVYYNQIRYPSKMVENIEESGIGGINRWVSAINSLDNDTIKKITGEDSYLAKEIKYANSNKNKEMFIEKVIGTVDYEPVKVEALNKYGNPLLKRGTDEIVYTDSLVNGSNEEVNLHYIDYTKVPLDSEKISSLMKKHNLKLGDVDYSNKLVNVFCEYIVSLDKGEIPLVTKKHIPNINKKGNKYHMNSEEDKFLDKELFSSSEFYKLLEDFSLVAGGSSINPEWEKWNKLSDKDKKGKEEPTKMISSIQPREEWLKWSEKSEEEKSKIQEPVKFDFKKLMSNDWCGSYYLMHNNEITDEDGNKVNKPISAEIGDGTLKNPAGLNTDIVTSIFVEEKDSTTGEIKRVAKPIRVRLIDYKVSQDAIDYFESKDERNRGYDIKSEIQYASYTFEVTNLSNEPLTIYDDSSLADKLANNSPRTGKIFGLKESVYLQPDETGIIESWGSSTELNTKYLLWGSDFKREKEPVWFRVLAGDIDDKSEDKGVALNNSRYEDDK